MATEDVLRALANKSWKLMESGLKKATVFMDDIAASHVRCTIGSANLFKNGSSVMRLEPSPSLQQCIGVKHQKLAFVVGGTLHQAQQPILETLTHKCFADVSEVRIYCGVSESEEKTCYASSTSSFKIFREQCAELLKSKAKVVIESVWMGPTTICKDFFFFPQCAGSIMPQNTEIELVAINLAKLLDGLNSHRDVRCWGCGPHSKKVLGKGLASRMAYGSNKVNVLVVDRALDLVGALSNQKTSLIDRIASCFDGVGVGADREIEGKLLRKTLDISVAPPATLLHPNNSDVCALVSNLAAFAEKDGRSELRKVLLQTASKAKVKLTVPAKIGKISYKQLCEYLAPFTKNDALFWEHSELLQAVSIAVHSISPDVVAEGNLKLSAEKTLLATAAEGECEDLLPYLTDLVPIVNHTRAAGEPRINLTKEELLSLTAMTYSIGIADYTVEDENQYKKVLCKFMKNDSANIASELVTSFVKLNEIRQLRDSFSKLEHLISPNTMAYEPLLKQIASLIFDSSKPELSDLDEGSDVKGLLQQSFGVFGGMMGMKSRPADCETLIVLVLGGITCEEVRAFKDINERSQNPVKVLFGGTRMWATPTSIASDLFTHG
eukprot:m.32814 g.32814  ORF g.32814 m.32814 type:complete len:609 (-) comp16702_c0_seq1:41-1867(-)